MRGERLAKNEALFRSVNERVKGVAQPFEESFPDLASARIDFVCECGLEGCYEQIPMTLAEYEAVRAHATRFAVVTGHETPSVERVIGEYGQYAVVEKHAEESRVALETDPRS